MQEFKIALARIAGIVASFGILVACILAALWVISFLLHVFVGQA